MYTGIIQEKATVVELIKTDTLYRMLLDIPSRHDATFALGASVSVDGVCLTVVQVDDRGIWFDAMKETIDKTTIQYLNEGDEVNIERSAKIGDEIGGHVLSGHIHCMATVQSIDPIDDETVSMLFRLDTLAYTPYIFDKGFIALNGASLTLTDVKKSEGTFVIYFIPETLRRTTFGTIQSMQKINVEVDQTTRTIVDTIERIMYERGDKPIGEVSTNRH